MVPSATPEEAITEAAVHLHEEGVALVLDRMQPAHGRLHVFDGPGGRAAAPDERVEVLAGVARDARSASSPSRWRCPWGRRASRTSRRAASTWPGRGPRQGRRQALPRSPRRRCSTAPSAQPSRCRAARRDRRPWRRGPAARRAAVPSLRKRRGRTRPWPACAWPATLPLRGFRGRPPRTGTRRGTSSARSPRVR